MSRPCSVCRDPRRGSIDTAVAQGVPIRRIASQHKLPEANVRRHASHIRAAISATQPDSVLDVSRHIQAVAGVAVGIMSRGDDRARISAGGLLLRTCEFVHALDQDRELAEIRQRLEALEQGLTMRSNGHQEASWPAHR